MVCERKEVIMLHSMIGGIILLKRSNVISRDSLCELYHDRILSSNFVPTVDDRSYP